MKINLLHSSLYLYFKENIKANKILNNQEKDSALANNFVEESSNIDKNSISNFDTEIKNILDIEVKGSRRIGFSKKKNDINVLLVEDNKTNQVLIGNLLKEEKYQFDIVKNGWEAICAFEACKYDLILMDINMPVLNGDEATKAIRKTNKQIPILALTDGEICDNLFEDKLYIGFNDVLSKPFNNDLFIRTVRNLITLTTRSIQNESGMVA